MQHRYVCMGVIGPRSGVGMTVLAALDGGPSWCSGASLARPMVLDSRGGLWRNRADARITDAMSGSDERLMLVEGYLGPSYLFWRGLFG